MEMEDWLVGGMVDSTREEITNIIHIISVVNLIFIIYDVVRKSRYNSRLIQKSP